MLMCTKWPENVGTKRLLHEMACTLTYNISSANSISNSVAISITISTTSGTTSTNTNSSTTNTYTVLVVLYI